LTRVERHLKYANIDDVLFVMFRDTVTVGDTELQCSTDVPCVNLRIISENGDNIIILKMLDSNTIGDVRKLLDKEW